jgi:hypothetical protein
VVLESFFTSTNMSKSEVTTENTRKTY